MKRPDLRTALDGWINYPVVDLPVTTVLTTLTVWANPTVLGQGAGLGLWYQALAALSGGLLALGTIVITLLLTVAPNDRLQRVIDGFGQRLGKLILRSLGGLVITTAGFVCLLLLDSHASRALRIGVTAALAAYGLQRFLRLWWILDRVIRILLAGRFQAATRGPAQARLWDRPNVAKDHYRLRSRGRTPQA